MSLDNPENWKLIDKTSEGFYCIYCKTFEKNPKMVFESEPIIIYRRDLKERWLVHDHYDGCRGWD